MSIPWMGIEIDYDQIRPMPDDYRPPVVEEDGMAVLRDAFEDEEFGFRAYLPVTPTSLRAMRWSAWHTREVWRLRKEKALAA